MEVSKLGVPLLMVKGNFRNLNSLTVEELESFIPFMTACSLNRGRASLINGVPEWWARTIQYKFPLKKPKGLNDLGYKSHLQSIVCKCYCYHDAHFLLSFSSKFSKYPHSIFLRSNDDNTTSIYSIDSTAEIFTFDNENKDYDNKSKGKPYWRSLLPAQSNKTNSNIIADIYLCENCDVEFYSQTDMQRHEKECYGTTLEDLSDEIQIIKHIKPVLPSPFEQSGFLDYFGLGSKLVQERVSESDAVKTPVETPVKRWVILNMCLHKNSNVEFSSLLGKKMLEHRVRRDVATRVEKSILLNESFCATDRRYNRFKPTKDCLRPRLTYRKKKKDIWSHTYSFTNRQRIEKLKTIKTGLNEKSRRLLKNCREVRVRVERLILPESIDSFVVCVWSMPVIPDVNERVEGW